MVSELVTNALRASAEGQYIVVRCYLGNTRTPILEVWDESPEPVIMRPADVTAPSGRGVFIIDQLCRDWQVHPTTEGGKLVRVEMEAL